MTTNVSYERGSGGYTFSSSERATLQGIQDDLTAAFDAGDQYATGLGGAAYREILQKRGIGVRESGSEPNFRAQLQSEYEAQLRSERLEIQSQQQRTAGELRKQAYRSGLLGLRAGKPAW